MARFKIGDRVRIVHSVFAPHVIGMQATVIGGLAEWRDDKDKIYRGHKVAIDGAGLRAADGVEFAFPPDYLEPLKYDGHQVTSWDALKDLWQPSSESAPA